MASKTKTPTDWNDWKPGSGQIKGGQHNLDKPYPYWRDEQGRPVKPNGVVDVIQWEKEQRERQKNGI